MNKNSFVQNEENKTETRNVESKNKGVGDRQGEKFTAKTEKREKDNRDNRDDDKESMNLARFAEVSKNLGEQIETQLQERPYVVLGAAAGVGFLLGSVLGSKLGQIAIAIGGGYLAHNLLGSSGEDVQRFVKEGIDKVSGGGERSTG